MSEVEPMASSETMRWLPVAVVALAVGLSIFGLVWAQDEEARSVFAVSLVICGITIAKAGYDAWRHGGDDPIEPWDATEPSELADALADVLTRSGSMSAHDLYLRAMFADRWMARSAAETRDQARDEDTQQRLEALVPTLFEAADRAAHREKGRQDDAPPRPPEVIR
jgi:hypothetical protein